jgi:hypothetical protein
VASGIFLTYGIAFTFALNLFLECLGMDLAHMLFGLIKIGLMLRMFLL